MFKAKDIMTRPVVTAQPDMPIYDAIRLLTNRNITGLPVVDEDLNLVGVLSEKDVLKTLYDTNDSPELTVADFMSTETVTFDLDANIVDLCDCLIGNVFRRVPITENGKLVGIASRKDIIQTILKIKHQSAAK